MVSTNLSNEQAKMQIKLTYCTNCDKNFEYSSTKDKICAECKTPLKYKCGTCFRTYKYSTGLSQHILYECNKKPRFSCDYCPLRTHRKENLTKHINTQHSNCDPNFINIIKLGRNSSM